MDLAKNEEKGRTPSLAISCLTIKDGQLWTYGAGHCGDRPLPAVKVITTMLPRMEKAMMPDITREAVLVAKSSWKSIVARSISLLMMISFLMAQNYFGVSMELQRFS